MFKSLSRWYDGLILKHPLLWIVLVSALSVLAALQIPNIKVDASADSLMLKGDTALDFFRQVSATYGSEDFLILTWQPEGDLLGESSLAALDSMAKQLEQLPGVSTVTTVLDVPLLKSPPLSLTDITSGDPLPVLRNPNVDRSLALAELTNSPIYTDLLVSKDGKTTAVQVSLERNEGYFELLTQRDALLREQMTQGLSGSQQETLAKLELEVKAFTAEQGKRQTELVQAVRDIAAQYDGRDAKIFVGGVPMIAVDMISFVRSDLVSFGSAILLLMTLILAVIFRQLRWVVIPLFACTVTAVMMLGLLAALDWRMTVISSNFVSVLLIMTLAIAIHLVVRYRELEQVLPALSVHERVLKTASLMIVPCIYTSLTTVVAFVSLVVSGIQPVIDFGWMMTVGIACALVICFIVVPCLIRLWPARRSVVVSDRPTFTAFFARFADRHGTLILSGSAGLLVLSLYGISQLKVENRFIDYFHDTTEIYQGMELLDSQLGGTIPLDIVLTAPASAGELPGLAIEPASAATTPASDDVLEDDWADDGDVFAQEGADDFGDDFDSGFDGKDNSSFSPSYWFTLEGKQRLHQVHRYLDSLAETGKVLSLDTVFTVAGDLMGEELGSVELALLQNNLPEAMQGPLVRPYFSAEKDQARISLRVMETSPDLRRNELLLQVRQHLQSDLAINAEDMGMTGMLVLYNNVLQSLFKSQILTLGSVFVAILLMFLLLFRSLTLALIALAPSVLAAAMVLGVMGLLGIPLDIMTITIAAIVVGIGVDNCIHYVHRFKREFVKDRDYLATMYRCHGSIGNAMYYTTVTVVVGFSTLALSNFNPSIYFGVLTVLAMLMAVLGALLLMPRLIMLVKPLGR